MPRTRIPATIAVLGAALALSAGTAFAASGWIIASAPPAGQNGNLLGVSAVSDADAWAVGTENGAAATGIGAKALIENWNGTAWTQVSAPATAGNTASLRSVSASGPADAWAAGFTSVNRSGYQPLALHWNGTAWASSPSAASALPPGTSLVGVADMSASDAYAIGDNSGLATGELEHWNGTTWSQVTLPQPTSNGLPTTLNTISASGPDDVWIVGSYMIQVSATNVRYETYSLHFDGTAWSAVLMPLVGSSNTLLAYAFNSVEVNSPTDVWAVGGSGVNVVGLGGTPDSTLIEHWNGTAWTIVPSPSPGSKDNLTGVTASNASDSIWAVGYGTPEGATQPQTLTLNWNGTAWTTVPSPDAGSPSVLTSVATHPGAAIVWAVGHSGLSGSFNPLVLRNG